VLLSNGRFQESSLNWQLQIFRVVHTEFQFANPIAPNALKQHGHHACRQMRMV
jgi:hypothetical protein